VHRRKTPVIVVRMPIEQPRSQFILAISENSCRHNDVVANNAMKRVAPPIDLGEYVLNDNAPATMLGLHGLLNPQSRESPPQSWLILKIQEQNSSLEA
jgi:hypothetical protein